MQHGNKVGEMEAKEMRRRSRDRSNSIQSSRTYQNGNLGSGSSKCLLWFYL